MKKTDPKILMKRLLKQHAQSYAAVALQLEITERYVRMIEKGDAKPGKRLQRDIVRELVR